MNMKKGKLFLASALVLGMGLVATQSAEAGFFNGKPFAALNDKIETNSTAIVGLTATTDQLRLDLDQVTLDLDSLTVQVAINTSNIDSLQVQVKQNRFAITGIEAEMKVVNEELGYLRIDVTGNAARIAELNLTLESLVAEWDTKFAEVTTALDAIAAEVIAQGLALETLYAEFAANAARVESQINGLTAEVYVIRTTVANNAAITAGELAVASYRIANLNSQVISLNSSLDRLQDQFNNHAHSYQDAYDRYTYYVNVFSHNEKYLFGWTAYTKANCRKPGSERHWLRWLTCKAPIYSWRPVYVRQARVGYLIRTLTTSTAN